MACTPWQPLHIMDHNGTIYHRHNGRTNRTEQMSESQQINQTHQRPKAKQKLRTKRSATQRDVSTTIQGDKTNSQSNSRGTDPSGNTASKRVPQNQTDRGHQRAPASQATGLTDKQEAFVQAYMSGENASDAYRSAYDAAWYEKPSTIWTEASLHCWETKRWPTG
jgi:hypothetical protein